MPSHSAPIVFAGGAAIVDGVVVTTDIVVDDGLITAVGPGATPRDADIVDCRGAVIAPGYIDLQCNGAVGFDLTSQPTALGAIGAALTRFGVTAYLPTIVTAPASARSGAIDAFNATRDTWSPGDGAVALGLHFEGPAISPDHIGAHNAAHVVVPCPDEIDEWIASDAVRLVTLAPEVDGAVAMASRLSDGGIVVACGHTAMTPDDFRAATAAGARYVTHLFNAMSPFHHRAPGPIGAVLADDTVVAGLIVDGIHVDPVAVAAAWSALGPGRVSLVSDAAPPLGMPYGPYRLGTYDVVYDATGVRTRAGVLAGSALALDDAVRNLMTFTGCSLPDAVGTVTSTPADVLGLADRGRIRPGARADLTVLDSYGALLATVIAGSLEWQADRWRP